MWEINMTIQARPPKDTKHFSGLIRYSALTSRCKGQSELFKIAIDMKTAGLQEIFIVNAVRVALDCEGISDLMKLWEKESDKQEKEEIIADIQDMIDAYNQTDNEPLYIKFNDLDTIAHDIRAFKDSLLQIVIENGGISHLAQLTGIPQPSLSRFFNSHAMPQRTTLIKIAHALKIDKIKIDFEWAKNKE